MIEAYREPGTLAGELFAENLKRTGHAVRFAFAAFLVLRAAADDFW